MTISRNSPIRRLALWTAITALIVIATSAAMIGLYFKERHDYISRLNGPDGFHYRYYHDAVWAGRTHWLGVPIEKLPLDLFVYQEILHELRPDVVIEAGTLHGGSALFFASMMDLLNNGQVITIDIEEKPNRPQHPRITYLTGSSTSEAIVATVTRLIPAGATVMVVLDSNHTKDHVLEELRAYHALVTPGHYLIVEDSNINGHPVYTDFGPGPMEAIEAFVAENQDFSSDPSREKFLITFNPRGYLKKKGDRIDSPSP